MSQFDYPRINFYGKCLMDPATANNGWYLPLVYFNPLTIEVFMPPRVYLQDEYLEPCGLTVDDIEKIIPEGATIQKDDTTLFKGSNYVEIAPVSDEASFREWARTPLGQYEGDQEYAPLYEAIYSPVNKGPLTGSIPGYWNYYGSMNFQYLDVRVSSIATGIEDGKEVLLDDSADNPPEDLKEMLGAKLSMNTVLDNNGTNASVMIDCLPTMSMYSQIFTDRLSLHKGDQIFFSGHPNKSSLRLVNCFRVVNENMPFGGSGVFISTIPTSELEGGEEAPILMLFKKYGKDQRKLKGVFVYQVVSEVEEYRGIDYRRDGNAPNPAFSILSGRIAPWYEGEMKSWTIARQLNGEQPYLQRQGPGFDAPVAMMTPALFQFNKDAGTLVLDFLNNFPIRNKSEEEGAITPSPYDTNSYEVYPLGELDICMEEINLERKVVNTLPLGSMHISEESRSRDQLYRDGGMYLIPLEENVINKYQNIENWNLSIYANINNTRTRIMTESPVVVTSDEAGLHCNQGDEPSKGYVSYTGKKEPCIIRIFNRGRPVKKPIEITFVEYKMSSSGALRTDGLYRIEKYADGDVMTFDTAEPRNAIYLFIPYRTHTLPAQGYPAAVVQTGFFVSLKVLHTHDFAKYLDPTNPDYPTEVTFQVLYDNLLQRFGLLAPTMNFHEERFNNPAMASEMVRRMHMDNWDKSWYMPASRDASEDQFELVKKWAQKFDENAFEAEPRSFTRSDEAHKDHLHDHTFFNK